MNNSFHNVSQASMHFGAGRPGMITSSSNLLSDRSMTYPYPGTSYTSPPPIKIVAGSELTDSNTVSSPKKPCQFLTNVVDECHASRFYALILEFYFVTTEKQCDDDVLCPMRGCRRPFANAIEMVKHLKECAYIDKGRYICPCCNELEKFRTNWNKRCSWNRTKFSLKFQKGLQAPAKLFRLLRNKPIECPNCRHPLQENSEPDAPAYCDETPYNPDEHVLSGDDVLPPFKPDIDHGYQTFDLLPPSKVQLDYVSELDAPSGLSEFPTDTPMYEMDSGQNVGMAFPGTNPIEHSSGLSDFITDLVDASVNTSSFSNSFNTSPNAVSPPSTVQDSCSSTEVSPTSSEGSASQKTSGRLLRYNQPRRRLPGDVPLCPTQQVNTAPMLVRNSYNTYQTGPVSLPSADDQARVVAGSSSYTTGLQHSNRLTVHTDFRHSDAWPFGVQSTEAARISLPAQTLPSDLGDYRHLIDSLASLPGHPQPTALFRPSYQSDTSRTASDIHAEELSDDELVCPEPDCPYKPTGKTENLAAYLSKHIKTHKDKKIKCLVCDKEFTRHDNMTIHLRRDHADHQMPKKRPVGVGSGDLQHGAPRKRTLRST
ncbi:hypothetical protein BKA67DRAFT_292598 [Truncatella angustata]|uniref:C2H2-type domain-containing protein n=1 Tax=Truncatella angustata TaxID=152316 RepID=A0A9P8UI89_9PEZI|nr:uncharacterized protein BKA67DRAFT_292598 [Truncatella angustata]KAH6652513.1 hypothetical protein BKA67DRAFT_292598 [Truncatella angustata]KAH8198979.1 hypothetical protein TruAng_006856 [Truncatella angustata]